MQAQNPSWRWACSPSVGGESLERPALEHRVGREVVRDPGLAEEEAAVDPVLGARLLAEPGDAVVLTEHGDAERQRRADDRQRRHGARRGVPARERRKVHVGDAVAVGGVERRPAEPVEHRVDPAPGRRVEPRVDALDAQAGGPVGGRRELRDERGAEPREQQDPAHALRGVERRDVPDDRPAADLDERLRQRGGVLLEPRAATAAEDHRGVGAGRGHRPARMSGRDRQRVLALAHERHAAADA